MEVSRHKFEPRAEGGRRASVENQSKVSKAAIKNALASIRWVAEGAKKVMENLHEQPDTMELEFGIKVTTKAGIIVAETHGEFHIKAKLIWNKSPETPKPSETEETENG